MKRQTGFGLVETMAVVAVIAILAAVGMPAMQDFITNQRVKSTSSDLFTSILRARSEAIKRNKDVTIAPTTNWNTGWTIPSPNPGEPALASFTTRSQITVAGPAAGVTFNPAGRVKGDTDLQFSITSSTGKASCIRIDLGGRPNVQAKSC
ncbi:type IV fimbrial biogenesis protein FimT [Duganella sp. CF458]|uniref:GspH/FimT family pseudopilin n=1 Tax=Duganella sp. CF458 TaxID=1884368 RepID=UPI0008E2AE2D|nr:GspH/FimT family pseudopilin [Duganella sp. CF458]SFF74743.1 type IV fimbrial biogenesis protein FimT [Duganella sp. CF458]